MRSSKNSESPVDYIIRVESYFADYSFSVSQPNDSEPYSEHFTLNISGKVEHTFSEKVKPGTAIEIDVISFNPSEDSPRRLVGFMDLINNKLRAVITIPASSVHKVFSILESGKADAVDLWGSELFRRKSKIRSFRVCSGFEWKDWEEQ